LYAINTKIHLGGQIHFQDSVKTEFSLDARAESIGAKAVSLGALGV
jgi:hypothetical protein